MPEKPELSPEEKAALIASRSTKWAASVAFLSSVVTAALPAVLTAILTVWVEAPRVAKNATDKRSDEIASGQLEFFAVNQDHPAERAGLVVVYLSASSAEGASRVEASGFVARDTIDKATDKVASAIVADQNVDKVKSISETSFTMPVPKGYKWRVATDKETESRVKVRWFSPIPLATKE